MQLFDPLIRILYKKFILLLIGLGLLATAQASSLFDKINHLRFHSLPNANVGFVVMNADNGQVLYNHNGYQSFTPASNMKLLTAAASLYELGPDYRYHTQLAYNQSHLQDHVLQGDAYLRFVGDPSLTIDDVGHLIDKLKKQGIHSIEGNFIIDHKRYVKPDYAPGMTHDNIYWYYGAPISAILINQNALHVQIQPNDTLGKQAHIDTSSDFQHYAHLQSTNVTTVTYPKSLHRCQLVLNVNHKNAYQFKGCWPIGHQQDLKLAVRNPYLLAKNVIQERLQHDKIKLQGHFKEGQLPSGVDQVAQHSSAVLKHLLTTMMKTSNNIYAESLTKTLGDQRFHQGSFQLGVLAIKRILSDHAGLDCHHARIKDGAGESRYNLITPMLLARLLYIMHNDEKLGAIYQQTLPDSGSNGTLKKRMTSSDMIDSVAAKTGSMNGVSTLSGYLKTLQQDHLIFVIMVNHITTDLSAARQFQDHTLRLLRRGVNIHKMRQLSDDD